MNLELVYSVSLGLDLELVYKVSLGLGNEPGTGLYVAKCA